MHSGYCLCGVLPCECVFGFTGFLHIQKTWRGDCWIQMSRNKWAYEHVDIQLFYWVHSPVMLRYLGISSESTVTLIHNKIVIEIEGINECNISLAISRMPRMLNDHFEHKCWPVLFPHESLVLYAEPYCVCNSVSVGSCKNDASDTSAWTQTCKGMV